MNQAFIQSCFLSVFLGFLGGVATQSLVPLPFSHILFLVTVSFSVLCGLCLANKGSIVFLLIVISLGVLVAAFGMLRLFMFRNIPLSSVLEKKVGTSQLLEGVVAAEPNDTENGQRATIRLMEKGARSQRVLVNADYYPRLAYGDLVSVTGLLKKPKIIESDTGRDFDYPAYLEKDRIYYTMSATHLEIKSHNNGSLLITKLITIKRAFVQKLELMIPKPESGLVAGYLVEGKQSLSKSLQEEFKIAGVIHTVALSGYNVTIIVQAVMSILSFLPFSLQLAGGAGAIVLFTLMTGASSTVVRAALMSLVAIFANAGDRTYNVSRALMFAAFGMVLWNPMTLVFDPSFQLSFLATLGLIYLSPILGPKLTWIPERFKLREIITSTLSAQLAVLPFILYSTNSLSIVALPTNILMLPEIPLTMLMGTLTAGTAFISKYVAQPFGWATYFLLHVELLIVHFFSHLPYAAVTVPFPLWLVVLVYIISILGLLYNSLRSRPS